MPYHEFDVTSEGEQEHQFQIGGGARVARIFLPATDNAPLSGLPAAGIATARRELARTIKPHHRVS